MKPPLARRPALVAAGLAVLALGASLVSGGGLLTQDRPPGSRDSRAAAGDGARTPAIPPATAAPMVAPAGANAQAVRAGAPTDPLVLPAGRGAGGVVGDAFAARGWPARAAGPAASTAMASPPPAAPASAPPPARLPFVFIGRLTEHGEAPLYVFERGPRVFTVRPGQMLDAQHRFESATAGELAVVQLPENIRHTIRIGP